MSLIKKMVVDAMISGASIRKAILCFLLEVMGCLVTHRLKLLILAFPAMFIWTVQDFTEQQVIKHGFTEKGSVGGS